MATSSIPSTQLKMEHQFMWWDMDITTWMAPKSGKEPELGAAIKESDVPREQLFVTTKVNQKIADISRAIDASLEKLQLSYVDLYLIHQPFFAKSPAELQDAWAAMENVNEAGKARAIGVSNFLENHLEVISQSAKIPPAINQIEYHSYLLDGCLVSYHEKKGITTASYGPLTPVTRTKGGPLDSLLSKLAQKYGVGEGEIPLRWSIDRGTESITTSGKESRLSTYPDVLKFQLTLEEVTRFPKPTNRSILERFGSTSLRPMTGHSTEDLYDPATVLTL